jgi:hypothetical protein
MTDNNDDISVSSTSTGSSFDKKISATSLGKGVGLDIYGGTDDIDLEEDDKNDAEDAPAEECSVANSQINSLITQHCTMNTPIGASNPIPTSLSTGLSSLTQQSSNKNNKQKEQESSSITNSNSINKKQVRVGESSLPKGLENMFTPYF